MIVTEGMLKNIRDTMTRWFHVRGNNKKELDRCRAQIAAKRIFRHQLVTFFEWADFNLNREDGVATARKPLAPLKVELDELEMIINTNFSDEDEGEPILGEFPDDFTGYAPGQVKKNRFDEDDLFFLYKILVNSVTEEKATRQWSKLKKISRIDGKNVAKYDGDYQHKKLIRTMLTKGDVVLDANKLQIYENIMKYCEHPEDPELFHADTFWKIVNVKAGDEYIQDDGTPLDYKIFYEGVKSDEIKPLSV